MRLINIDTCKLESFFGTSIPPYAILSHTWGSDNEELSFADIQRDDPPAIHSIKVLGCLDRTRQDRLRYAWIDTCCIDKTNSVELNEAINSMFRWYEEATICYVYLAECPNPVLPQDEPGKLPPSSWFRRGWTLQELVAPKDLRVYDQKWTLIGDRRAIAPDLSRLTGIPITFLAKYRPLREARVAQRMSWASNRVTKREEDIAYCLLGIFGITMAMNYGEQGARAFQRLQRHILEEIDDDSILAWGLEPHPPEVPSTNNLNGEATHTSALATSPSDFSGCGRVIAFDPDGCSDRPVFAPGHIQVHGIVLAHPADANGATCTVLLRCGIAQEGPIAIPLARTKQDGIWARPESAPLSSIDSIRLQDLPWYRNMGPQTIKVCVASGRQTRDNARIAMRFFTDASAVDLQLVDVYPQEYWEAEQQSIVVKGTAKDDSEAVNHIIIMRFTSSNQADFHIIALMNVWTGRSLKYSTPPAPTYAVMGSVGTPLELEDYSRCYRYYLRMRRASDFRTTFFPLDDSSVYLDVQKIEDNPATIFLARLVAKEKKETDHVVDAREELQLAHREMANDLAIVVFENSMLEEKTSALEDELEEKKWELKRVSALEIERVRERNRGLEKISALEAELQEKTRKLETQKLERLPVLPGAEIDKRKAPEPQQFHPNKRSNVVLTSTQGEPLRTLTRQEVGQATTRLLEDLNF